MAALSRNTPVLGDSPIDPTVADLQHLGIIFPTATYLQASSPFNSMEFQNPLAKGIRIYWVVPNGSGTVTFKIQTKDPYTNTWSDLGPVTAALNNSNSFMDVYPGITGIADVANVRYNNHLGLTWRVVATVAVANEQFSLSGVYLL